MSYSASTFHLLALLWTLGIETSGMALLARVTGAPLPRAVLSALGVNLIVHTLFWYSQPYLLGSAPWPWGLYGAEALVVLVEGWLYAWLLALPLWRAWRLSFLLNVASLFSGLWLWQQIL